MSERMTGIRTRDGYDALVVYGHASRQEMIDKLRAALRHDIDEAQALLEKSDDEFIVETFLGIHARRNVVEVK